MEWQPIETAPKDGRSIIVWPPTWDGTTSCARWNTNEYAKNPKPFWERNDVFGRVVHSRSKPPTHWMNHPAPPKATE